MDYQFSFNHENLPHVEFSIEHKAFEVWFNEEFSHHIDKITSLLAIIEQLEAGKLHQKAYRNIDSELQLDGEEVQVVSSGSLNQEQTAEEFDEFDEGYSFYNAEANAGCGLEDFKACVEGWLDFVS